MKKEKLTVLFCQIGTAITYLSLKWFPLPLPLSVAFTKFIIFTYKDSYINQSATFHSDRTNLNIKREKCDFSFFNISIGHKLSLSLQNLIINPFNYMAFTNNIMIVRHRLLTELVKLWKNGELTTDKNRPSTIRTQPPTFKTCRALLRTQRTRCMEIQIPSSTGVGYG